MQPVVDIDGAVTQLMAKWIQQQQSKVQRLVASATDSEDTLADPLCNMSAPATLDLIYMTSEPKDPFVARPYLWNLLRLLQTKLAKTQAFCLKNGLDAAKWSGQVRMSLQQAIVAQKYECALQPSREDALQLLFEHKLLSETVLKEVREAQV